MMTQAELDALLARCAPETPERIKDRREAQLELGRLWDRGVVTLAPDFTPILNTKPPS